MRTELALMLLSTLAATSCSPVASLSIEGASGLDSVELFVLSNCPTGPADLFECRSTATARVLIEGGAQTSVALPLQEGLSVGAVGYRDCAPIAWACSRADGRSLKLALSRIPPGTVPRCDETACGPGRSCELSCGGPDGDDDADGVSNRVECCSTPCETLPEQCPDTDEDGAPNHLDLDSDGDGYADRSECSMHCDSDSNGTADSWEANPRDDYDSDGISNAYECDPRTRAFSEPNCIDSDGDGLPNYRDADSDADGTSDRTECPFFDGESICPYSGTEPAVVVFGPSYCGREACNQTERCQHDRCCNFELSQQRTYRIRARSPGDRTAPPREPPANAVVYEGSLCNYPLPGETWNWRTTDRHLYLFDVWNVNDNQLHIMVDYWGPALHLPLPTDLPPQLYRPIEAGRSLILQGSIVPQ